MNNEKRSADSVSAVLFCYNEARYIEKAIKSLQNQTAAVDEIIIVDDYSSDETVDIVKRMANSDKRIRCLTNAYEKGKVSAYQTGLEAVRTDFFFVMGADDEAKPDLVAYSLRKIGTITTPFFFHSAELIDEASVPIGRFFTSRFNSSDCFYYNRTGGLLFGKSEVIKKIIPFPKGLEFEDWYTVLTLFIDYGDVQTSSNPLINYRIHSASDSQASKLNWQRRKSLLMRDVRFLELMHKKLQSGMYANKIYESIRFRKRLVRLLPTLGIDFHTSMLFGKTFISFVLTRFVSWWSELRGYAGK